MLRHEIPSSRCYFNMAPPSAFEHKPQTRRKLAFNHILFTSSTDIALLFLNRKKRQCNKYVKNITIQSQNSKIQMSKLFACILFIKLFISDAQSQVIRDARYNNKIAGSNP